MKKIVVLGPESTGKSTLCQQLAMHYKTTWCPEFAREYLNGLDAKYTYEDLLNIAMGQTELEDAMMTKANNGIYFIDTDMYVMKVWCEVAFENCHNWILKQIATRKYDMYFLCNLDIAWVKDDLREYPDINFRRRLFKMYKDIMVNSGSQWVEISGVDGQRLQMALEIIDTLYKRK